MVNGWSMMVNHRIWQSMALNHLLWTVHCDWWWWTLLLNIVDTYWLMMNICYWPWLSYMVMMTVHVSVVNFSGTLSELWHTPSNPSLLMNSITVPFPVLPGGKVFLDTQVWSATRSKTFRRDGPARGRRAWDHAWKFQSQIGMEKPPILAIWTS